MDCLLRRWFNLAVTLKENYTRLANNETSIVLLQNRFPPAGLVARRCLTAAEACEALQARCPLSTADAGVFLVNLQTQTQ